MSRVLALLARHGITMKQDGSRLLFTFPDRNTETLSAMPGTGDTGKPDTDVSDHPHSPEPVPLTRPDTLVHTPEDTTLTEAQCEAIPTVMTPVPTGDLVPLPPAAVSAAAQAILYGGPTSQDIVQQLIDEAKKADHAPHNQTE